MQHSLFRKINYVVQKRKTINSKQLVRAKEQSEAQNINRTSKPREANCDNGGNGVTYVILCVVAIYICTPPHHHFHHHHYHHHHYHHYHAVTVLLLFPYFICRRRRRCRPPLPPPPPLFYCYNTLGRVKKLECKEEEKGEEEEGWVLR